MSDKFLEKMVEDVYMVQNNVEIYIPRYQNNAIQFTGDDIGGDQSMMLDAFVHTYCNNGICFCRNN